jgi:hypothetical protein
MVLDGVFPREAQGPPAFHCAPPPSHEELDEVVRRVHRRAVVWLDRKGPRESAGEDPDSRQPAPQTFLDACATIAKQRGSLRTLRSIDHNE